ncbi:MAG: hypothetical protein NTW74_08040 [Acidobacteria bacterium]|nr:hypothetical protein [Acidobacteriota bacterium]
MKNLKFFFFVLSLSCAYAQSSAAPAPRVAASKPDPKVAPVKRHPDGRPLGIPFSATKVSDGAWRAIENGKPVIYRSTAFGFSKLSEEENGKIQRMISGKPDEATEVPVGLSVAEKDGKLLFKRITPFGNYEWTKDKNDLTVVEKNLWLQTQASSVKGEVKQ